MFATDCIKQPGPTQRIGIYRADLKYTSSVEESAGYVSAELVDNLGTHRDAIMY